MALWSKNLQPKKRSIFERITGGIRIDDENEEYAEEPVEVEHHKTHSLKVKNEGHQTWAESAEEPEGQLSVDVYQTPSEIIIVSMVAGVRPEDLQVNITRDMVTIKGKREESRTISEENYFTRELYWGAFSRTILLPQEVEPEEADATEKHGLLVLRLPKIDKGRKATLRVKSI